MPDYWTPNFLQGANDAAGKLADGKVTARTVWIDNAARLEPSVNRYATVARIADRLKLGNFKVDGGHANGSLRMRRWVAFYGWNVGHCSLELGDGCVNNVGECHLARPMDF